MNLISCDDFISRRSPVFAKNGMVASSQPLATGAGLEILSAGGNAADAAVAVAAALQVTQPCSTGLGGDCFCLFYHAENRRVYGLNGSGASPAALDLALVESLGFQEGIPPYHALNVTVPGAPAGWVDTIRKFGTMEMSEILTPAIRLAEEGFPVAPMTSLGWSVGAERQLAHHRHGHELTIGGRGPAPGELFRNPGLAAAMRTMGETGAEDFYEGDIAERIVKAVQEAGGVLALEDLAAHRSDWVEPIAIDYRGFRIFECPPNGQGAAALIALNILEQFEPPQDMTNSSDWYHIQIECMRVAFADAARYIADPRHESIPLEELLSNNYAAERAASIRMDRTDQNPAHGVFHKGSPGSDTVYFSVTDGYGNGCSFINSNYMGFGTGIVPEGCGYSLQNRGQGFVLEEGHPNCIAPKKRPYHTIIPALATYPSSSELFAVFGVMGGFMQPQGHLQVASWLIDGALDPQAALDRLRFQLQLGSPAKSVLFEAGPSEDICQNLEGRGHNIERVQNRSRGAFGLGQVILRENNGVYCAGSDPRGDGCAMGL